MSINAVTTHHQLMLLLEPGIDWQVDQGGVYHVKQGLQETAPGYLTHWALAGPLMTRFGLAINTDAFNGKSVVELSTGVQTAYKDHADKDRAVFFVIAQAVIQKLQAGQKTHKTPTSEQAA